MAVLGLCCCVGFASAVVWGLLTAGASRAVERGLEGRQLRSCRTWAQWERGFSGGGTAA